MKMKKSKIQFYSGLSLLGLGGLLSKVHGADAPAVATGSVAWQKPAWLTDLGLSAKESYDDNVLGVSGSGMTPKSSWITTVSPKVGFNFAPLLGKQSPFQTLSLSYSPDFNILHGFPSESYNAHKLGDTIKGKSGDFSFALDNAFLYNDGNHQAPIYADNQLGGALANQNDKYRNNYAHGMARERLAQIQDRTTVVLQYDWDKVFIRPAGALIYYDLNTDWHNTGAAPWKGYQNYVDRYDINGGADAGYKVTKDLSVLLGYRYGHQYQQQFALAIDADQHHTDSDYQRVLLGLEGKPWQWLNVKLAGGPDFRKFDSTAPVYDPNLVTYYGEASLTATLTPSQSLSFLYKGWQWVSSTGNVPQFDSSYALNYHWNATKQLGFDLGGKFQEGDYSSGNDVAGSGPSVRDDVLYTVSAGVSYAFSSHLSANLSYTRDLADNGWDGLAAKYQSSYRQFNRQLVSVGMQYKF